MPMDLSIKGVAEDVVNRLKERAKRHNRSLQGELKTIVEAAAAVREPERLSIAEIRERVRQLDLPRVSESTAIIRHDRDHEH